MKYHQLCAPSFSVVQLSVKVGVTLVRSAQLELVTAQKVVFHLIAKISTSAKLCVDCAKEENAKIQMGLSHVYVLKDLNTTARLKLVLTQMNAIWEYVLAAPASIMKEASFANVLKITYFLRTGRIAYLTSLVAVTLQSKVVCAQHL
jgi:hypothetical protein